MMRIFNGKRKPWQDCCTVRWLNPHKKADPRFSWQSGYSAFSVSQSQLEAVRRYVRNQEVHHKKISFKEKLVQTS
jgi:hypothetical protein